MTQKYILMLIVTGMGLAVSGNAGSQDQVAPTIKFALPIACEIGRNCEVQNYVDRDPSPASKDYVCGTISYQDHSGIDFRLLDLAAQRAGVNVLAAAPGRVTGVRDGVTDVSVRDIDRQTISGRECGNGVVIDHGAGITTQYCHMRNASIRAKINDQVVAGTPIGQVGLSGNTEYPHLHFTVRRGGAVIDPFAPLEGSNGQCGGGPSMWQPQIARALTYKAGVVLNTGFASTTLTMAMVEAGGIEPPTRNSPALIAYVRSINLKIGDTQQFTLKGPDGVVLATHNATPMITNQAQRFVFIGKNKPASGWPAGRYSADYSVLRSGRTIMQRQFELRL